MTLSDLHRALVTADRGSLTISPDGSAFFVRRWGLERFNSLPELTRFIEQINGGRSADLQSAVSQVSNLPPDTSTTNAS